jgi:aspartate aminotransferase
VGEPDFDTPDHVKQAAKQAMDAGKTRYTPVPGLPELRDEVARYFERFYGAKAERENAIVTNGGKQALFNLMFALLEEGDEVLLPTPYWVSYPDMAAMCGASCVQVRATAEAGFKVTVDDLERGLSPRTKMLVFNSPSNPTGAVYSQAEVDAIAEWAVKRDVFVIADEVYDRLVFPPAEHGTFAPWWQKSPEHIAIVGALSKTFAMTGWRVGFALAHADLVKAVSKIQGQSTSNVCSIAQHAALAAFTGPWDLVDEMREAFARRRDLAVGIISGWKGAVCPRPEGAFYVFPDISAMYREGMADSQAACAKVLDEAQVALVPGSAFGDDGCIRVSFAVADDVLEKSLAAVGRVLLGS